MSKETKKTESGQETHASHEQSDSTDSMPTADCSQVPRVHMGPGEVLFRQFVHRFWRTPTVAALRIDYECSTPGCDKTTQTSGLSYVEMDAIVSKMGNLAYFEGMNPHFHKVHFTAADEAWSRIEDRAATAFKRYVNGEKDNPVPAMSVSNPKKGPTIKELRALEAWALGTNLTKREQLSKPGVKKAVIVSNVREWFPLLWGRHETILAVRQLRGRTNRRRGKGGKPLLCDICLKVQEEAQSMGGVRIKAARGRSGSGYGNRSNHSGNRRQGKGKWPKGRRPKRGGGLA